MSFSAGRGQQADLDVILASSGVRAPCFIGGLKAIQEKGYRIERIAGTSGGAIIAAGFALGHSIEEMYGRAQTIPYDNFKDFGITNLLSLKNPSVYTGRSLDEYYQSLYGDATLKDFKIDCRISVVSIVGRKRHILTRDSHPDLPVWKAVRMSSTIPFIFPWYDLDGEPVTDGALVTGMFDMFPDSPRPVISLRPRSDHFIKRKIQDVQASNTLLWSYLKIIAEYFMDAVDSQHVPDNEWSRTVIIPTFEIGGFNFNLEQEDVERLVQYGFNAVIISNLLPYVK